LYKRIALIIAAAGLAACNSATAETTDLNSADASELEELQDWGKQLKAEDNATAHVLIRQCWGEGSLMTDQGKLKIARCMKRKYDEGLRG
jgi:hypothetical protein